MTEAELIRQAIDEPVSLVSYDLEWPATYAAERDRLLQLAPELTAIEHIGSTAVPWLIAKPIIDLMACVSSMAVADILVDRLCANGYLASAGFNRTLGDRRWLMRQAGGHRTHHLHLVLADSLYWKDNVCFRDAFRRDGELASRYAALKEDLAAKFGADRERYTDSKTKFIAGALKQSRGREIRGR